MLSSVSVATPQVGSLVRARGRDWVVLPSDEDGVVRLRPLTGSEDEAVGIFLPIERDALSAATFAPLVPQAPLSRRG